MNLLNCCVMCLLSTYFDIRSTIGAVKHVPSAPYHPASNGLAERAVKNFQDWYEKDD